MIITKSPFHSVKDCLDEFEKHWLNSLASEIHLISDISDYLIAVRGKRFRPGLVYLSALPFDLDRKDLHDASLVVELIHMASLLHDDVIDESLLRRGVPSVFNRWNKKAAILMGDYLFSLSFNILVGGGLNGMMKILANSTVNLARGEMMDVETEGRIDITKDDYFKLIKLKTAALISACCAAGPSLAGMNGEDLSKYSRLASLCLLENSPMNSFMQRAARMPVNLFAVIDIPIPVPQTSTALSNFPTETASAASPPVSG